MYVLAHVNLLKILLFKWTIDSVACSFNLFFILVHKQMQIENMKICICNNNIIPPNIVTVPINLLQILSLSLSTYCKYCHCPHQIIANSVTALIKLLQIVSLSPSTYCKRTYTVYTDIAERNYCSVSGWCKLFFVCWKISECGVAYIGPYNETSANNCRRN